jgi:hypothetical protein
MHLSPLQLDTNCYNTTFQYHPSYYTNSTPPLLYPSARNNYSPSPVLQPIENYYSQRPISIPCSSEVSFSPCPSFPQDDFLTPSSSMVLPQNRANYTRHQLVMLNEIFKEHKYPNSVQKTLIAKYIGVSRDQIRIWFQNKRRKLQLINKGQAKQSKNDIECGHRQHLPNHFLDDLFGELYHARAAPARLPVKRFNNNSNMINIGQEQQNLPYYPTYYQTDNSIEHNYEPSTLNYTQNMY